LTYTILSNSDPSLFDTFSINSSTKSLVLNTASDATGRAEIVVRATDAGGLSVDTTITIDVNRENQPPEICNLGIIDIAIGVWRVSGDVVDPDDDVGHFIVEFSNTFNTRAATDQTGHFEFIVYLAPEAVGLESIQTCDPHGGDSPIYIWDMATT
jgi:hypothetical protein